MNDLFAMAKHGEVLLSPCVSDGERQIARAALAAKIAKILLRKFRNSECGKRQNVKHGLRATSSVASALKDLLGRDLLYRMPSGYIVYDRFFGTWLRKSEGVNAMTCYPVYIPTLNRYEHFRNCVESRRG